MRTIIFAIVVLFVLGTYAVKMPLRFGGPTNPTAIGSRDLPVEYTEVQDAAKAAVALLNQKETGITYTLVEVLSASTLYREGHEYNLILKLSNQKQEKSTHKVTVRLPLDSDNYELVVAHHMRGHPTR